MERLRAVGLIGSPRRLEDSLDELRLAFLV
jgi:hypothetical protein